MYDQNKLLLYGLLVMLAAQIGTELAIIIPITAHQRCKCNVRSLLSPGLSFNFTPGQWLLCRILIRAACRTTRTSMHGNT